MAREHLLVVGWGREVGGGGAGIEKSSGTSLACVASVSNRVIARKFLDEPREETLATQARTSQFAFEELHL